MHSSGDDRCAWCAGPPCDSGHDTRPAHPAASHSPPSCSGAANTTAPVYDAAPRAVAHDAAPHLSRCALRRKWATRGPAHCVGSYGITEAAHRPVRTLACPCAPAHDARSPAHANRSFAFHSSHIRAPLSGTRVAIFARPSPPLTSRGCRCIWHEAFAVPRLKMMLGCGFGGAPPPVFSKPHVCACGFFIDFYRQDLTEVGAAALLEDGRRRKRPGQLGRIFKRPEMAAGSADDGSGLTFAPAPRAPPPRARKPHHTGGGAKMTEITLFRSGLFQRRPWRSHLGTVQNYQELPKKPRK